MEEERKKKILQYAAAISASLTIIGYGCSVSWTSPSLPHLTSKKSQFPVSENQSSWIASLVNVGMILGYIINALIIDKIGRKKTLLLLSIPQITACILIILARNWLILCISRIIIGIGYGGGLCAAIAYLAEIGDQNTRGIFLVMVKLSLNTGIFFVMLLGAYLPYNNMNFVLIFLPLIFLLSFSFMPNSFQSLEKERKNLSVSLKVEKEMKEPKEVEMELTKIHQEEEVNLLNNTIQVKLNLKMNKKEKLKLTSLQEKQELKIRLKNVFTIKNNRKAFMIVSLIFATEALSGHAAVMAYTQEIFDYSGSSLSAEYATLVMASMKIIASLLSTQIIERVGRKTLFLVSGILATIAQGTVGIFFLMKLNWKMDVSSISWIPLFGVTMYEVMGNAGIGSLAFVYIAELFSPDVKGVAITLTSIVYEIVAFFVKLQFRIVVDTFGISGTFLLFSTCCVIGTGIVFYLAPETRGMSLEEIQEIMDLGKRVEKGGNGVRRFCRPSQNRI